MSKTKLIRARALQPVYDHIKGVVIEKDSEFEQEAEFVNSLAAIGQVEILEPGIFLPAAIAL